MCVCVLGASVCKQKHTEMGAQREEISTLRQTEREKKRDGDSERHRDARRERLTEKERKRGRERGKSGAWAARTVQCACV